MRRLMSTLSAAPIPVPTIVPIAAAAARGVKPVQVFVSEVYSAEDRPWRHRILIALQGLATGGRCSLLDQGAIGRADLILLLLSPDTVSAPHVPGGEVEVHRQRAPGSRLVPVLLRPVDLGDSPVRDLQALPRDGRPLSEWSSPDRPLNELTALVRAMAEPAPSPAPAQLRVYLAYAEADRAAAEQLARHAAPLERSGQLRMHLRVRIPPGDSVSGAEAAALREANLIVLMLSVDFLADPSCDALVSAAMAQRAAAKAWLLPIQVRPIGVIPEALAEVPLFPDGQALSQHAEPDLAYSTVVRRLAAQFLNLREIPLELADFEPWSLLASLEDLRAALHEPPLPAEADLLLVLAARHVGAPGPLSLAVAQHLADEAEPSPEAAALLGLDAEVATASDLATQILLRRRVAASAAEHALRVALLGELERVLGEELQPKDGSFARLEPGLLRWCAQTIDRIDRGKRLGPGQRRYLSERLVAAYRDRLCAAQILEFKPHILEVNQRVPRARSERRDDLRLAAALFAMAPLGDFAWPPSLFAAPLALYTPTSPTMEGRFIDLASREPTLEERARKREGQGWSLGWDAALPISVPELALWCLLGANPGRFADLGGAVKQRWIEMLAARDRETALAPTLVPYVLEATAAAVDALSAGAMETLEVLARGFLTKDAAGWASLPVPVPEALWMRTRRAAWLTLIRLFGYGRAHLQPELDWHFHAYLDEPFAADLFSYYMAALAESQGTLTVTPLLQSMISAARLQQIDPTPFVLGLARTINTGSSSAVIVARSVLRTTLEDLDLAAAPDVQQLARLASPR